MNRYDLWSALTVSYQWILAAHIIFVIFWVAGLFMLPRYYVYHQEAVPGSEEERRWVERERKLRSIILTPAMLIVWALGITLATIGHHWDEPWLHAKLLLVLALSAYHGWMIGYGRKLARGERPVSGRSLRLMNEVPGIATAAIVILAVVKPL